jgi:hypothetical protein
MPETLTVGEYDHLAAEEDALHEASQEAGYEDYLVSRLADEIAHYHCGMPNEPQVFLAARNAAEDVLVACKIRFDEGGTPYVSEAEAEKASQAARAAARAVVYRLLRLLAARRGNPPGYWPTASVFRMPMARTPRASRTRRLARASTSSRGDPSEPEPDRVAEAGVPA